WLESATVKRSLGNGPLSRASRSNAANVLGTQRSSRISRYGRQVRVRVLMTNSSQRRDGLRFLRRSPISARRPSAGAVPTPLPALSPPRGEGKGEGWPVRGLLGAQDLTGRFCSARVSSHHSKFTGCPSSRQPRYWKIW